MTDALLQGKRECDEVVKRMKNTVGITHIGAFEWRRKRQPRATRDALSNIFDFAKR